jgi:hypothetical protein
MKKFSLAELPRERVMRVIAPLLVSGESRPTRASVLAARADNC